MSSKPLGSAPRVALILVTALAGAGAAYGTASGADGEPTAAVELAPNPLAYDDVPVGRSQDKTVTIKSTGTGAAQIASVTQYGRDRTSFDVVSETCTRQPLAPGASCSATVRFKPTKNGTLVSTLAVGSRNACTAYDVIAGGGYSAPPAQTRASCQVVTNTVTTTTPGSTTTAPGSTTTTPGATIVRPNSSSVASLSITASKCSSRRVVTLHVRPARKQGLRSAKVTLNGKVVRRFGKRAQGKTITTTVVLRGKPRARFDVTIDATGTNGKKYRRTQHFITCIAKKPVS